tara:strand:+ start:461 stop:1588 length:1128 start_codon:yes stop_codon:yes gene_type:complete
MSPKPPFVLEILRTSSLSSLSSSLSSRKRREGLFASSERRRVHQREKTFRIGNENNNKQLEMRMMISGGESSLKRRRKRRTDVSLFASSKSSSERKSGDDDDDDDSSSSSGKDATDDVVPISKIYSLLSLSIFALLAGDVGMNFLAFLFAWVTKQGDLTFFTTNANGFWTEKLCILGFVILLLMDFKAVATRQIRRANAVLKTIKYAKETTVESIEQTRNVETFLTNVYMKSTFEILGALIALVGCLRTASPSLVPGSGALFSLPASIGPAIALFFGHAMFMLINTNVISQSANMTTPFPLQIRKTIATFDAMLAMLATSCATFQKGWPGLIASSLFLLFSIYFTYENEIKKKMKERKKKAEKKGGRDFGSSSSR